MPRTVLVTGGAGYIGSHTCAELLKHDYDVVVVDDYSNSSPAALERVQKVGGRPLISIPADMRDRRALDAIFEEHSIDAVIHFAAKKAVGESMNIPLVYYDVNLGGTKNLLHSMQRHGVQKIVFSSSCSIYGESSRARLSEDEEPRPTNPYARSKWMCEQVIRDACKRCPEMSAISLRYFNPIGAHPSGLLGEVPAGLPNNIVPYLMQVAVGRLKRLSVFGSDYDTPDGTAVRDYIHVLDVVAGHRAALEHLDGETGTQLFNLGTGVGTSVLQLVAALSEACGRPLPYELADRRPGDVATLVADSDRIHRAWGWRPVHGLKEMCRDAWRFQRMNPRGYAA